MNKIKKYFFIILLLEIFFAYAPAYAQTTAQTPTPQYGDTTGTCQPNGTGVCSQISQYLCTPNSPNLGTNPNGVLFSCINQIYKFAIIVAAVVGVFFIVIGGYIYMSADGNQESVDKGKDMLVSTLTALVILFTGYVILGALNPDLVKFNSIQTPNVTLSIPSSTPVNVALGTGSPSGPAQQLINLNNSNTISLNNSGSCQGNNPLVDVQAVANGQQAVFDGPGTLCNQGTTSINAVMLQALVDLANKGLKVTVTSLTSGHHSSATDPHYSGNAVDLVPQNLQTDGQNILQSLINDGAQKVAVERNLNGVAQFIIITIAGGAASTNATACTGQPNYHWHAQWSGPSGILDAETN